MRGRYRFAVVLVCSLLPAFAWSYADAQSKKGEAPARRYDANNQTAMSEAMVHVVDGSRKFVEKDVEGALTAFRQAVKLAPRNALAQYALGEALLAQNKPQEAEAPLMAADDAAAQTSPYKARVVFVLASCKERLHKWEEAKELWRRYLELAQNAKADAGVYPQSGNDRLKLVDDWAKMDAAYANVRARIGGGSASSGGAAGASDAGAPK